MTEHDSAGDDGPGPEQNPESDAPEPTPLTEPADGLPDLVADTAALADTIRALAAGTGPVAIDTERAHGFRYSTRAYLVQLRRAGAGTRLIDPVALQPPGSGADAPVADLGELRGAIGDAEWIIHAATQDLPCLAQIGLRPTRLFDTELAGRLLGFPRVALGTMVEQLLGLRLRKEHSAADWSTRPLPVDWLVYAALDVEVLIELRDRLEEQLRTAGKHEWARQEFAALVDGALVTPEPREDPWRRTSGMHSVAGPAGLALVRELWQARDEIARAEDRAPGKVLPDRAISALAEQVARDGSTWPDRRDLHRIEGFRRRIPRTHEEVWLDALARASRLTRRQWPASHLRTEGPPAPRSWQHRYPEAAARLARARAAIGTVAEEHELPQENLIAPDAVRRLAWQPPDPAGPTEIDRFLADLGVRPWQRELTVGVLVDAIG